MSHGEDLYRSFRPRAARWVAGVLAVVVLVFMVTLAAALPLIAGDAVGVPDRVGMVLFGAYSTGTLMPQEFDVHRFHQWVLSRLTPDQELTR